MPTSSPRRTGRSILAVAAGFLAVVILTTIVDVILHTAGVYPPLGVPMTGVALNLLALSYRIVITIYGGYLTARLAPQNPMKHVIVLASIGLAAGAVGVIIAMNVEMGPIWYPVAILITGPPCTWLGGVLFMRRHAA